MFEQTFNNPLSPPTIPPKFVLQGLSARSKFLAAYSAALLRDILFSGKDI